MIKQLKEFKQPEYRARYVNDDTLNSIKKIRQKSDANKRPTSKKRNAIEEYIQKMQGMRKKPEFQGIEAYNIAGVPIVFDHDQKRAKLERKFLVEVDSDFEESSESEVDMTKKDLHELPILPLTQPPKIKSIIMD